MSCKGCKFNCKTIQDLENVQKIWDKEKKYYWLYQTERMKKVVCMGELQKEHLEHCTGATLTRL